MLNVQKTAVNKAETVKDLEAEGPRGVLAIPLYQLSDLKHISLSLSELKFSSPVTGYNIMPSELLVRVNKMKCVKQIL